MGSDNKIIEIKVKVILIGEFNDFESWLKNTQDCANKHGVTSKILHIDCNGYTTTGYNMRNSLRPTVYPVKTYLQVQDDKVVQPLAFKSPSNN
ncbi:hypothetical protein AB9T89_10310 [Flavobacterium oncorhynchi]|uniref:hypothetical protein n=1 Tax=Flavobacterium oncorhynchi TaxID=728056 RepID=UPI00351A0EE5